MASMTSTLTSKGQTTLPKAIRQRLGLETGAKVTYEFTDNGVLIRPKRRELLIMKYRGVLKHLDDGRPMQEIIEDAHRAAAEYIVKRAHRR